MEVEIISREYIKLSSPTPLHLKTYKICLLDQSAVPTYTPLVLYYPNPANDLSHDFSKSLQTLKQSLSETLTLFYPFAGKVKDNLSIDCHDDGVQLTVAQVKNNISLNAFLTNPSLSLITKFLPGESSIEVFTAIGSHLLAIQVTTFSCGGIVIGVRLSHLITDAKGLTMFLKTWAAIAKTSENDNSTQDRVILPPNFDDAPSLFPQTDSFPKDATDVCLLEPFLKKGRCVITRIVFDASTLATLKSKVTTNTSSGLRNPTSVEVVTAVLFKSIMRVFKARYSGSTDGFMPMCFTHPVNLRPKAEPPLLEYSIGNIFWNIAVLCTNEEPELHDLVLLLREEISKVNKCFVESLQGEGGLLKLCEAINDVRRVYTDAAERVGFSSWRHFGLYDIDFGWGKPIWVSCDGTNDKEDALFLYFITLMDTRSCDGIEAWVYVDEQDISILHNDKELLAFVKMDPSPLEKQFV